MFLTLTTVDGNKKVKCNMDRFVCYVKIDDTYRQTGGDKKYIGKTAMFTGLDFNKDVPFIVRESVEYIDKKLCAK